MYACIVVVISDSIEVICCIQFVIGLLNIVELSAFCRAYCIGIGKTEKGANLLLPVHLGL